MFGQEFFGVFPLSKKKISTWSHKLKKPCFCVFTKAFGKSKLLVQYRGQIGACISQVIFGIKCLQTKHNKIT